MFSFSNLQVSPIIIMSNLDDIMDKLIEKSKPHLSKLSFGGLVGYCSGAAAKKIGKAVAVLAGLAFITVQSAVHLGYMSVDWNKVRDDAVAKVDTVSSFASYALCILG